MENRVGTDSNNVDGNPDYKASVVCEYLTECEWHFWKKAGHRNFYTHSQAIVPIGVNIHQEKILYSNLLLILEQMGRTKADFHQWLMSRRD